jgi:hypothetical protein
MFHFLQFELFEMSGSVVKRSDRLPTESDKIKREICKSEKAKYRRNFTQLYSAFSPLIDRKRERKF